MIDVKYNTIATAILWENITMAGILLCFSEMPKVVASGSMEATLFFTMFPFPLFTLVGPSLSSTQYPALILYRLAEHTGHFLGL